jgi:hypothetical protein
MNCFACGGPYHPATGHLFREYEDVAYCGPCIRHFINEFVKKMMQGRRWGRVNFYEEAAKKQTGETHDQAFRSKAT